LYLLPGYLCGFFFAFSIFKDPPPHKAIFTMYLNKTTVNYKRGDSFEEEKIITQLLSPKLQPISLAVRPTPSSHGFLESFSLCDGIIVERTTSTMVAAQEVGEVPKNV